MNYTIYDIATIDARLPDLQRKINLYQNLLSKRQQNRPKNSLKTDGELVGLLEQYQAEYDELAAFRATINITIKQYPLIKNHDGDLVVA